MPREAPKAGNKEPNNLSAVLTLPADLLVNIFFLRYALAVLEFRYLFADGECVYFILKLS